MRQRVSVQGVEYSKSSFGEKWKTIVNSTECNFFVKGEDEKFLEGVIDLIPKWKSIKDRGVRYKIRSKKFQGKPVRGVVMVTPNSKREIWLGKGSIIDMLFPRETEIPEYKKNRKDALMAMRQIIEPQIKTYRTSVLRQLRRKPLRCKMTGDFIEASMFHIDHVYPFKNLVQEWCRDMHVDLENIDVYCRGTKCYFKSTDLAESWFDYHLMNAKLQALSAKANLEKGSKYYGD